MHTLGISAYYHDSAAAIVSHGKLVSAAQEERFTRKKADSTFPANAILSCLKSANLRLADIDNIIFYDKPFLKFERLIETYLNFVPRGFNSFRKSMPLWISEKLFQKDKIIKSLSEISPGLNFREKIRFAEHHESHAASAFFPSPFSEAVILTMDGVGEWATTSVAIGRENSIQMLREIHFPHSLGLLYSAVTYYLGFKVNSGEYKIMGLAPYGTPRFKDIFLEKLIDVKDDGSYRLRMEYFNYCTGMTMTNHRFHDLFGAEPRRPEALLTQMHMDIAASIQFALEYVVLLMTQAISKEFSIQNLCLAGGVALNCVANGKIKRAGHFKNIWVQPAAGDAGAAVGAAYIGNSTLSTVVGKKETGLDGMSGSYLGPEFTQIEIESELNALGAKFEIMNETQLLDATVEALMNQNAVGWFQGRMEFGPRALGARSILADPRSAEMQKLLNLKVKFRESFRPFAPSVLAEYSEDWFDHSGPSPYMMYVADILPKYRVPMTDAQQKMFGIDKLNVVRSTIPSVTHVDYSARLQTVHKETNPRYYGLIRKFYEKTNVPMVVNTSFNVRGEPIVCSPTDAYRCFMGTGIETLVIGNCFLRKAEQPESDRIAYHDNFELD